MSVAKSALKNDLVYFTNPLQTNIPFKPWCISHTFSAKLNKPFDPAVPLTRCSVIQVFGHFTKLTHIPLTLVDSFSASHKSGKTNGPPTRTDRVFGDTLSRVQPWDVLLREPQGCGRVTGSYTPHRDTERYKAKKRKIIWCERRTKIVWEHTENLRTSQLHVPSTPTLLIKLGDLASLYRDCFHQTAQAINRVAADMLFNKNVGVSFPIRTSKEV